MKSPKAHEAAVPPGVADLDEAFLQAVDQAILHSKQRDPWRLARVHFALEEEAFLAGAFGQGPLDSRPPSRRLSAAPTENGE